MRSQNDYPGLRTELPPVFFFVCCFFGLQPPTLQKSNRIIRFRISFHYFANFRSPRKTRQRIPEDLAKCPKRPGNIPSDPAKYPKQPGMMSQATRQNVPGDPAKYPTTQMTCTYDGYKLVISGYECKCLEPTYKCLHKCLCKCNVSARKCMVFELPAMKFLFFR